MKYDPIKEKLGVVFNSTPLLRKTFYRLLDLLLLRAWHVKKQLRLFNKTHQGKQQVLDAGAGFGQYTYFMSGLNPLWNITAVDVKTEQIADCNQFFKQIGRENRVTFILQDLTKYVNPSAYNLVLCVDVMEHIEEDVQVFKNFYASLTSGGTLLVSTPSDQGGSDAHDHHDDSFIEEHVRNGYNASEIEQKLQEAGFSEIEIKYSYGKTGSLGWRLSMKYPILMLNSTKLAYFILPFYYVIFYPIAFVLNFIDVRKTHKKGTGLIVKALKAKDQ